MITGMPSGRSFVLSPAFGMYTRRTARGFQEVIVACTCAASSALAREVSATSPSIPAVLRPALRCATCRTLTSVLDQLRSINFCRFLTVGQSCSRVALKIRCRSRRTLSSCSRQLMALQSSTASVGPFTPRPAIATAKAKAVIVSNLPFGSRGSGHRTSRSCHGVVWVVDVVKLLIGHGLSTPKHVPTRSFVVTVCHVRGHVGWGRVGWCGVGACRVSGRFAGGGVGGAGPRREPRRWGRFLGFGVFGRRGRGRVGGGSGGSRRPASAGVDRRGHRPGDPGVVPVRRGGLRLGSGAGVAAAAWRVGARGAGTDRVGVVAGPDQAGRAR